MTNRSTPSDKIVYDPIFTIPEGAEDQFTPSREDVDIDENEVSDTMSAEMDSFDEEFEFVDDGYDEVDTIILDTPNNFSVISQILRRAPGGQQVVDIVIQTEDIEGAIDYERQVTKS